VLHIDYTVSFDKGLSLPVPEIVPFRLTPVLSHALGFPSSDPYAFAPTADQPFPDEACVQQFVGEHSAESVHSDKQNLAVQSGSTFTSGTFVDACVNTRLALKHAFPSMFSSILHSMQVHPLLDWLPADHHRYSINQIFFFFCPMNGSMNVLKLQAYFRSMI
jgi:hypothetical protein